MTSRDFVYWLQGALELSGNETLSKEQVAVIRNHLNLVFKHEIDPIIDGDNPETKKTLQQIHDGLLSPGTPPGTLLRC